MAPDNLGRLATVRAADEYYAFIDGWTGRIADMENGLYWLELEGAENGTVVKKRFLVPPDQLKILP